jgi:hypothetical protein
MVPRPSRTDSNFRPQGSEIHCRPATKGRAVRGDAFREKSPVLLPNDEPAVEFFHLVHDPAVLELGVREHGSAVEALSA